MAAAPDRQPWRGEILGEGPARAIGRRDTFAEPRPEKVLEPHTKLWQGMLCIGKTGRPGAAVDTLFDPPTPPPQRPGAS